MKLKTSLITLCVLMGIFLNIPFIKNTSPLSRVILDRNGDVLTMELSKDDKFRHWVGLSKFNPKFVSKIIEKEDKYFYYHFAVNPYSLLRATFNFLSKNPQGGASTITMQLARLYFKLETKTILGKINQIMHSFFLEFVMTKHQILEAYLNLIPMGKNIEGLESASFYYFKKPSKKLTKIEIDFLSFLPQNPSLILALRDNKLETFYPILKQTYPSLNETEAASMLKELNLSMQRPFTAPHFSYHIQQKSSERVIKASIDKKIQLDLESILKNYISSISSNGIQNATMLLIDSRTNEILSYIGSADYYNNAIDGQVDGLQALRSPGSTLKPFIYAKAFELGLLYNQSIVYDSPLPYRTPENYDRTYQGPMTVEDALISSRNIPAVYINNELQKKENGLYNLITNLFPSRELGRGHYGSSIALGAYELSSLQLGALYSMLSNNGEYDDLYFERQEKRNKDLPSFLSEESSIMVKDILKKHLRPNFSASQNFTNQIGDVFWKTGTSFGFRDAWAVGIWNKYVLVTWVGDFKGASNPFLVGSISAAPLFFKGIDYLRHSVERDHKFDLKHYYHDNLSEVEVCAVSGHLPNENCSAKISSLYIKNKSPIKKCDIHRRVELSKKSHLRTCPEFKGEKYEKTFEFFSHDKIEIYKKYGITLSLPPKFDKQCQDNFIAQSLGVKPLIISPKIGFTYIAKGGKAMIPLKAKVDADSSMLSWYLGDELLQKSSANETIMAELSHGKHLLRVIDSFGRESLREVLIK